MEENSLKKKTIGGFIWRFAERCGAQGVQFVVSIILARLLAPEDFGVVSLVLVFVNILNVFVDSGMGNALIQKKNSDELDFSSVFYFNIVMCATLYLIMFFCAPLIANFYEKPELVALVRVVSLTLVISGVKSIQHAYVARNMLFKRFFFATLGGTIFSAFLGILLAYRGAGSWAIVAQQLSNYTIDTIILWLTTKWRPKFMFSFKRLKSLFSFGWKLLVSGLIDTGYNQLRSLIIGKVYSASDLAYFNKANSFPGMIITNVNSSIDGVLLPSMSKVQDSKDDLKAITRRAMKTSVYIMAPLLFGLIACGKAFISILLTDKWLPSYPYMAIFCITYIFYPINTANLNAIKAMGRSDLFLKLEIIKKTVGLIVVLITYRISVMAMAYSLIFISLFTQILNSLPNKKLMKYSYFEQMKDLIPSVLLAGIMCVAVYSINFLNLNNWLTIIIQIPLGAVIYIGLSAILKLEPFMYCLDLLKSFLKNRN